MLVRTLVAVALAFVAADAPKDDSKKDLEKLQGVWTISSITYDGGDVPADIVSKLQFEVKGDQWAIKGDDEVAKEYAKATVKVDASPKPRLIDFHVGAGSEKGSDIEGIYEWNGADEIKVCAKVIGKERPAEFASAENSRVVLMVLKRQSK
jgi:uncharacterized protein (TIGR03067 family)